MRPARLILCMAMCTIVPTGTVFSHSGSLDPDGGHFDREEGTYHQHRQKTISRLPPPPIDIKSMPNKEILKVNGCYEVKAGKERSLQMFTSHSASSQQIELRKTTTFKVAKTAVLFKKRWYGILYKDNNKTYKKFIMEEDWHKFEGKVSTLQAKDCVDLREYSLEVFPRIEYVSSP